LDGVGILCLLCVASVLNLLFVIFSDRLNEMDMIGLGEGPRLAAWIEAARVHPHVRSIAVVSRNERDTDVGTEVRRYSTLQSACKEIKPSVALLTGTAALDRRQAVEALEHGMDIILDRPDTLDLITLTKLTEVARSRGRLVILALEDAGRATASRLRRLVRNVGSISHVSYIDRRPRADLGVAANARHAQLIRFGLDQIESLRSLFDASPVRVMARYTEPSSNIDVRGTTAEVLLELERNIHVQYFGSTGASHHEQSLWVEGKGGSLRSEGASVWWRKRGWPRFLLWRWKPGSSPDGRRRFADAARRTFDLIQQSAGGGASADDARRAAAATLALLGAVMRSSQESRLVDVADWTSSERQST
jgi:predicted dehydrogenase